MADRSVMKYPSAEKAGFFRCGTVKAEKVAEDATSGSIYMSSATERRQRMAWKGHAEAAYLPPKGSSGTVLTPPRCWGCLKLKADVAFAGARNLALKGGTLTMITSVALQVRLAVGASGVSCVETAIG